MKDRKSGRRYLLPVSLAAIVAMAGCLTGCGGQEITITVEDKNITTQAQVEAGDQVSAILQEVEIPLNEKDQVEPDLDTAITEDESNIVIKRYAKVTIIDEDKTKELEMLGGTAADALKDAGITLGEDDSIDCSKKAWLSDGMTIVVTRVRNVTLKVNGETQKVKTSAMTVSDLLKEYKLKVGKNDRLNVKKSKRIEEGDKIVLDYVSIKEEKVEESIPYETEKKYTDSMKKGQSKVTQAGKEGKKEITYKVTYVNGKEESREKTGEKVLEEPVKQVVTYGTKVEQKPASSSGGGGGKSVVSRQKVYDCDGSGHGYEIIRYSDGSESYSEF